MIVVFKAMYAEIFRSSFPEQYHDVIFGSRVEMFHELLVQMCRWRRSALAQAVTFPKRVAVCFQMMNNSFPPVGGRESGHYVTVALKQCCVQLVV